MGIDVNYDLSVEIHGIRFKNPVMPASGTFGFGREISEYYDLSILGGIVSKGITRFPRKGNPPCRISETCGGMLNSVGLQNPGICRFIKEELQQFTSYGCVSIVNIAGSTLDEYVEMTGILNETPCDIIELNLSCPNVKDGCMAFGSSAHGVFQVMSAVRKSTRKPVWVKLTPNTTDIKETALAVQEAGGDAVSLINTLLGLSVDLSTMRPVLYNNYGGLSGPAIKPIALRMVNETYRTVSIPVIGIGGIMNAQDVLEFLAAGASAVQIGTANIVNPLACYDIINQLESELSKLKINRIQDVIGQLELW
jgi:dihydroorotate dehydrogenase (NAD+) catalytic subunit